MPSMSASSRRPSKNPFLRQCLSLSRSPPERPAAFRSTRPTHHPNTRILPPKTCSRRCIDRSDRQLVNSGFPDETAITPKLGSEWSPTERFVSGPAQTNRATRPFVDLQSALCRTAPSPPSTPRSQDSFNQPSIPTAKQPALNGKLRNTNSVLLTHGEVLVEGLGRNATPEHV